MAKRHVFWLFIIGFAAFYFGLFWPASPATTPSDTAAPVVAPAGIPTTTVPSDPSVIQDALCEGEEIVVSYPFQGIQALPFECKSYCDTRETQPHFILYTNGFGTQCGKLYCNDWGEDRCITCAVPEEILMRHGLERPTETFDCIKSAVSSSSSEQSSASGEENQPPPPSPEPAPSDSLENQPTPFPQDAPPPTTF